MPQYSYAWLLAPAMTMDAGSNAGTGGPLLVSCLSSPAAIEAASPRASAAVATITTATATAKAMSSGPSAPRVSPSTVTPSSEATTGSVTVIVGNDAVSALALNDDC